MNDIEKAKERLNLVKNDKEYLRSGVITKTQEEFITDYEKKLEKSKKRSQRRSTIIGGVISFIIVAFLVRQVYLFIDNHYRKLENPVTIDRTNLNYINDLYLSDNYLFDHYLQGNEKKAYLDWLDSIKRGNKIFKVNYDYFKGMQAIEIREVFSKMSTTLKVDHPELFYFDNFVLMDDENDVYKLEVINSYNYPFKILEDLKYRRIERVIDRFVTENKDKNLLNKIKAVYDFFEDKKVNSAVGKEDKTISSSLTKKNTTCEAIALGSQVLLQRMNINSRITYGYLNGEPRSYNIIRLDDGLYFFDACVVAGLSKNSKDKYNGLLLSNYYDYEEYIYNIKEKEMGTKYIRYS